MSRISPCKRVSCLGCGKETIVQVLLSHPCFGVRGHEDIEGYWQRKKRSSAWRGIPFHITGAQMITLFEEAGITPADITNKRAGGYNLCRTNDEGAYEIGNVRFDTHSNNSREHDSGEWTPERRKAQSERAKKQKLWSHRKRANHRV